MTIRTIIYSIALFALTSCEQLGSVNDITPEYVLTDKNVLLMLIRQKLLLMDYISIGVVMG